jgi:hypothetical protein
VSRDWCGCSPDLSLLFTFSLSNFIQLFLEQTSQVINPGEIQQRNTRHAIVNCIPKEKCGCVYVCVCVYGHRPEETFSIYSSSYPRSIPVYYKKLNIHLLFLLFLLHLFDIPAPHQVLNLPEANPFLIKRESRLHSLLFVGNPAEFTIFMHPSDSIL